MKKKNMAMVSLIMAGTLVISACGSSSAPVETTAAAASAETPAASQADKAPAQDVVTIQIGFENTTEEPIGKAVEKWAELLEKESGGTMKLQLVPNSALGSKSELIDQMIMGENIITIADGAFYADYGVPDLGILYGPFFFDNWDQVWKLLDSEWYHTECGKLADKGLTVLASNWVYGERELMTKTKVVTPSDRRSVWPTARSMWRALMLWEPRQYPWLWEMCIPLYRTEPWTGWKIRFPHCTARASRRYQKISL